MKCTVSQRRDFSSGHCKCNLVLRVFASQNPSHKRYCVPDAKEIECAHSTKYIHRFNNDYPTKVKPVCKNN